MSPGWSADWHVGVRATQSKKLVAFISAVPMEIRVRKNVLHPAPGLPRTTIIGH